MCTVAVLGLGAMGLPMATRLASGLAVHGFDIAEPRLELAKEAGIATFASAREAAKGADAVLLAVRNGEQLNEVLFGPDGVAGAAGSFMLSNRGPRILEAYNGEGAEVLSRLDIFVKDMGIVGKAARAAGLAAPVAAADDSAVIRVVAPTRRTAG